MKVINETKEGNFYFILAEGEALCVNSVIKYKGENCRVLSCWSFINDSTKYKTKLLRLKPSTTNII